MLWDKSNTCSIADMLNTQKQQQLVHLLSTIASGEGRKNREMSGFKVDNAKQLLVYSIR